MASSFGDKSEIRAEIQRRYDEIDKTNFENVTFSFVSEEFFEDMY
jgi:hypothetical protein